MIKKQQKKSKQKTDADHLIPALANQKKIEEKLQDEKKKKEDQKKLQDEEKKKEDQNQLQHQGKKKEDQKENESWKKDLIKSENANPGAISALANLPQKIKVISEAAGR